MGAVMIRITSYNVCYTKLLRAYHPEQPLIQAPGSFNDYPVLPTAKGGLYNLEQQSLAVLKKINDLPVEQTLTKLDDLLSQSRQSVAAIGQLSQTLNRLAGQPATQQIPAETLKAMQQLQQTLAGFVITSYSIHYTKLYEPAIGWRSWPAADARRRWARAGYPGRHSPRR